MKALISGGEGGSAQNTRGRWAIRPRELHNRPRQVAHGGDCKIKNRPRAIIK